MNNSALPRLFVIILTVFLLTVSFITAYADEDELGANPDGYSADAALEPTESSTAESSVYIATTEPIIPADFPAMSVNAISNFFPKSSAEYNANTKELTVTYWLRSTKDILSVKWNMVYDTEVLSFSLEKNPAINICPSIGENAVMFYPENDTVSYSASSLKLFDFSSQDMTFAQLVFDVKTLNPEEAVSTKVDLSVEELIVSDIDTATGLSDPKSELIIVDNSVEYEELDPIFERLTRMTTMTASNFVQATSAPPEPATVPVTNENGEILYYATVDEPQTTAPSTAPAAATSPTSATDPSGVNPPGKHDKQEPPDMGKVSTGGSIYAWICLGIITVSTSILFVMRKKEIMY